MSNFASLSTATRLRDVVQSIVRRTLAKERPAEAYGTIVESDDVARKATVLLAGSTSTVIVSYGHVQPAFVGQIVRIGGVAQDRYIIDIVGPPLFPTPNLDITNLFANTGIWFKGFQFTAAWPSYTPVVTQSITVAKTITFAKYLKIGRLVIVYFYLPITGTGTANQIIQVSMPFTAANGGALAGVGWIYNASAATNIITITGLQTATNLGFLIPPTNGAWAGAATSGFTEAITLNDVLIGLAVYESAT